MNGSEALSTEECMQLLASRAVGHVGYTEAALPLIRPVNYALLGSALVLRARFDGGLVERLDGQIIAFEVDDADSEHDGGWTVSVSGIAHIIDKADLAQFPALPPLSRDGSDAANIVQIMPGRVHGRQARHAHPSD